MTYIFDKESRVMIIRMRTISLLQTLIDYANTGKINIKHGSIVTPDE